MPRQIMDGCVSCEACVMECPVDCIDYSQEKMRIDIDADICIDCGACQQVCPLGVIEEINIILNKKGEN